MIYTTLNKIRAHNPCSEGWAKLLRHLGKTQADDEPLALATILDSNGLDDALWCLRAVYGHEREMRLYAVWCARQVQNLTNDPRSLAALDVAERHANGRATDSELVAAHAAARAAVNDPTCTSARHAAMTAARAAAWFASAAAAWGAAWAAAAVASAAAAWDTAGDAAGAAAKTAQTAEFRRAFCGEKVTA